MKRFIAFTARLIADAFGKVGFSHKQRVLQVATGPYEQTAALDSSRAQRVMDLLRRLAAEQEACIVTVTHDDKIFDRLDRLVQLRDGRLGDS